MYWFVFLIFTVFSFPASSGLIPSKDAKVRTKAVCEGNNPNEAVLKQFCSKSGRLSKTLFHCTNTGKARGVCEAKDLCTNDQIKNACAKYCVDDRRSGKPDKKTIEIQRRLASCPKTGDRPRRSSTVVGNKPPQTSQPVNQDHDHQVPPLEKAEQPVPYKMEEDGLPSNPKAREELLVKFYHILIPKLIALSWEGLWVECNKSLACFLTPYPYNPYRQPGVTNEMSFPSTPEEWEKTVHYFTNVLSHHTYLTSLVDKILSDYSYSQNYSLTYHGKDPQFIRSLYTLPEKIDVPTFNEHLARIKKAKDIEHAIIKIEQDDIPLLKAFYSYHLHQISKIESFLQIADQVKDPDKFYQDLYSKNSQYRIAARTIFKKLQPFFIPGKRPAHKLVNVEDLQIKERGDADVVIYDASTISSKHMNFEKSSIKQSGHNEGDHGMAVASIIAGKDTLHQLKGVAPGARVISITEINHESIQRIKKSKARVINISLRYDVPKECHGIFKAANRLKKEFEDLIKEIATTGDESLAGSATKLECLNFWEFAQLVKEKDMIIVKSAGNEGLQLEEVDWETGKIAQDLTDHMEGAQYSKFLSNKLSPNKVDLNSIFHQIPQLKDRLILVGNLNANGVTIANSSSLPGAFPDDFIYAPSQDILSVYSSVIGKDKKGKDLHGQLGAFGGTSGAAPRVTGVLVLLNNLFPDLPMTTIRKCVLETGTPFWKEPGHKYSWLKSGADPAYLKRLYGMGRINGMNAYACCAQMQEEHNKSKVRISALNLD